MEIEGVSDFTRQIQFVVPDGQDLNFFGAISDTYVFIRELILSHSARTHRGREEHFFFLVPRVVGLKFPGSRWFAGSDDFHLFPVRGIPPLPGKWLLPSYDGNSVIRTARSSTMEKHCEIRNLMTLPRA